MGDRSWHFRLSLRQPIATASTTSRFLLRRGLAAARDLRKGELVLRVPKSALMTSQRLMKDQKLFLSLQKYSYLSSTQISNLVIRVH